MFSLAIQILSHLFLNSCALSAVIRDLSAVIRDRNLSAVIRDRI